MNPCLRFAHGVVFHPCTIFLINALESEALYRYILKGGARVTVCCDVKVESEGNGPRCMHGHVIMQLFKSLEYVFY